MSKFHLVLTNIGARNVGSNLSKDQQHKQQLVQINFKGKKIKTESVGPQELKSDDQDGSKMCTNWEEEVKFELEENELQETDVVKVKIFQKGKLSIFPNKLLGKVDIPLEEIVAGKRKGKDFSVNLNDGNNQPTESMFACILSYTGNLEDSSESKAESKTESKSEYKGGKVTLPQEYGRKKDQPMDYSMSTHEHVRRNLSNKELDFQIKVKVIEARQLEGGDINPVVRLTIGNEKKQTRVKQTTNRPRYNQTFSFNFISTTFRDLFDKQIKIEMPADIFQGYKTISLLNNVGPVELLKNFQNMFGIRVFSTECLNLIKEIECLAFYCSDDGKRLLVELDFEDCELTKKCYARAIERMKIKQGKTPLKLMYASVGDICPWLPRRATGKLEEAALLPTLVPSRVCITPSSARGSKGEISKILYPILVVLIISYL